MDLHDFYTGRTFDAHRFFGAHFEGDCVISCTYAPGAPGCGADWRIQRLAGYAHDPGGTGRHIFLPYTGRKARHAV